MKILTKITLVSIPVLMSMTTPTYAGTCSGPCVVESANSPWVELRDSAGQDWYMWNSGTGTDSEFRIGIMGGQTKFSIDDDALNNTLNIDTAGRVGINTKSPDEELTINSVRPAIRLNDTTAGSFDFNLVADGSNFALEDAQGNNIILVEGNTSNTPLWLDSTGRVGLNVANPIADLHVGGSGDIFLENGTQDWAIQTLSSELIFRNGNNTTFGSWPIRIDNLTPNNTLVTQANGNIGMGTFSPDSALHVRKSAAALHIEDTNATAGNRQLLELENKGGIGMRLNNTNSGSTWDFNNTDSGNFTASKVGTGGFEFEIQGNGRFKTRSFGTLIFDMRADGNLHIPTGDVIVGGSTLNVPDYVFEHDYELMPLDELKGFVAKNKHLPNVPSEAEIKKSKQLSMAKFQMTHLEKIEELTLYTLQQHDQIKTLQDTNVQMQKKLDEQNIALKTENGNLKERLASLEKLVTNLAMSSDKMGKGDKVALK